MSIKKTENKPNASFGFAFKQATKDLPVPPTAYGFGTTAASPASTSPSETLLESPWRLVEWTEERKKSLMEVITSFRPTYIPKARVLFVGPIGSGKSSFISSVQSAFSGRVTNCAMLGSSSKGCTKKIRSLTGEVLDGFLLCDVMGLGDSQNTGVQLHDILSVIKGHIPEGHTFSSYKPVMQSETEGFIKTPKLSDQIHCVVFVLSAAEMESYPTSLGSSMQQLREHISDMGIHQVALLTHVDQVCLQTAKDVTNVYKSPPVKAKMEQAAAFLDLPTSYIVPVKNYFQELDVDMESDVLLLSAMDHILHYCKLCV